MADIGQSAGLRLADALLAHRVVSWRRSNSVAFLAEIERAARERRNCLREAPRVQSVIPQ